jgi:predicted GIY-YIG superfamily endonuclease
MCYEYPLRKKAVKAALESRKEAVSMRKQVNSWLMEAKLALIAKTPKQSDSSKETPVSVWERLTG